MAFYKLESIYNVIPTNAKLGPDKKTYRYFANSYESMKLRFEEELQLGATVKVKEISEAVYTRGTR